MYIFCFFATELFKNGEGKHTLSLFLLFLFWNEMTYLEASEKASWF